MLAMVMAMAHCLSLRGLLLQGIKAAMRTVKATATQPVSKSPFNTVHSTPLQKSMLIAPCSHNP